MTENQTNKFNPDVNISRRDFLRLAETFGLSTVILWLGAYKAKKIFTPPLESLTPLSPTNLPKTTATPFATGTPTQIVETAIVTQTPEPTPTNISKEQEYAHFHCENTDLRKTVGPIDWTKAVTLTIPAEANLLADQQTTIIFPTPLNVTEGSWDEMADKTNEFNQWWDPEEKVMTFAGNPSAHPFLLLHAYQLKNGKRTYAGEYFRRALDKQKESDTNPLIGKFWIFEQEDNSGKVNRVKMSFVHMTELSADDFWNSMFVLDSNNKIIVDYNHAWKPDPHNPRQQIPLIPEEYHQPQHLTLATCDHGGAAIATLKIESVEEIKNPLALFWFAFYQGLAKA
ncbi:MAG TPA: hypothetical protein PLX28_02775 [Candidatus Woesebacteria bacterium]|nr:hypothetical protein [Candidatus Woesebacteria bacterium]